MIRFRTIEPAESANPAPQPTPAGPVAAAPAVAAPEETSAAPAVRKGAGRRTSPKPPKTAEPVPLFDK